MAEFKNNHGIRGLLTFNMMVKRRIILSYSNKFLEINKEYTYNLEQEIGKIRDTAFNLCEKYSNNYAKDNTYARVENLLCILELPPETRDIDVIKKQYKKLVKKYHPDVYKQSDIRFKDISDA